LYSSEVLENMNQLSTSLKETYANVVPEDGYLPVKGEVCVAKYTVDQVTNHSLMNCLIECFNLPHWGQLMTTELLKLPSSVLGQTQVTLGLLPPALAHQALLPQS
jgi:hypothetical protein